MPSARLFIRNDDVWTLDAGFRFYFDQAMERGIAVVHAVIPGKLEKGLARFLCQAKQKTPDLLDIVQHGWMHTNHCDDGLTKYEFGPSRSLKSQQEDISMGLKKMRAAFGENFTHAFVPPYHGFDERTLKVLNKEEFKLFSAGTRRLVNNNRFINLPVQLSFSCYEKNKPKIYQAKEIIAMVAKSIHRKPLTGVLTHHKDFASQALRREITRFFDAIAALKAKEEWQVMLFSEFLSGCNRGDHGR